jgi:signal transduction histidine kinase
MAKHPMMEADSAVVSRTRRSRHDSRGALSTYGERHRVERFIAGTRLALTLWGLLAIIVDPSGLVGNSRHVLGVVLAYSFYSMTSMVWSWLSAVSLSERVRLVTQIIDAGAAVLIVSLAGGTYSPVFVFMVFPLLSASLRWQWRGAVWTGASLLAAYGGVALYTLLGNGRVVHVKSLMIEGVYLVAVTLILAYVGYHNDRIQRGMTAVAAWDPPQIDAADGRLRDLLGHLASVVDAPRVLLVWKAVDQPLMTLALWEQGQFHWTTDIPAILEPPIAEPLRDRDFMCRDAGRSNARVVCIARGRSWRWRGSPLGDGLRSAFAIRSVIAVCLRSASLDGRLFVLDKPAATSDDLVVTTVVARRVENVLEHDYLARRFREAALALERTRVAREVHDGALQSLTAAGLRLETIRCQLDDGDRMAALDGLHELQTTILLQQRELRSFVHELQTGESANDLGLGDLFTTLAFRIQQEWQLAVKLDIKLQAERLEASISSEFAREIHQIVREALVNTARHTLASFACVSIRLDGDWVRIKVADNGQGFPFRGRFEDVELAEGNLGPVMLRQRIAALGGRLTIDTNDDGATLEISLPRHGTIHGVEPAAPRPYPSSVSLRSGPLSPV